MNYIFMRQIKIMIFLFTLARVIALVIGRF